MRTLFASLALCLLAFMAFPQAASADTRLQRNERYACSYEYGGCGKITRELYARNDGQIYEKYTFCPERRHGRAAIRCSTEYKDRGYNAYYDRNRYRNNNGFYNNRSYRNNGLPPILERFLDPLLDRAERCLRYPNSCR